MRIVVLALTALLAGCAAGEYRPQAAAAPATPQQTALSDYCRDQWVVRMSEGLIAEAESEYKACLAGVQQRPRTTIVHCQPSTVVGNTATCTEY